MNWLASGLLAAFLALIGAILAIGGVVLITEGGSWYYLAAGLLVLGTAFNLFRGSGQSLKFYAALLAGTLVWSLWEVGLDGWALAPRLLGPAVIGAVLLLLPARKLTGAPNRWWLGAPVLAAFGAVGLAGIAAMGPDWTAQSRLAPVADAETGPTEWRNWGNTPGGSRYAPVAQITPGNVSQLELAWRYDSDMPLPAVPSFEATPLADDGRLYVCLKAGAVAALDQTTGKEIWRYVSPDNEKLDFSRVFGSKCRGVSFYEAPEPREVCSKRIIFSSPDGYLRAIDAKDGKPCPDFGEGGAADLHEGMAAQLPESRLEVAAYPSSPPAIVNGVIAIGQTVSDLASYNAPAGVIRGYDALSGELLWAWNAEIPDNDEPDDKYARATPNSWGVLSGDEELGLIFVPLGNSLPDYFAGMRTKDRERFNDSVVALDAATGKLRWSYQTVHHDIWDYDLTAQPVAVDLPGAGGVTPALFLGTKLGQIFVLDRRTGEPLDKVIEKPVPQEGVVPEDWTSKTQPYTTGFPSLSGPDLTEKDMWGITPLDQMICRIAFRKARYEGQYTPIGTDWTLMFPGTAGGINWGSMTIDEGRGLMVVNTMRFANLGRLVPRKDTSPQEYGGLEGKVIFGQEGAPYAFQQKTFMSPAGVPCQNPPFGTINAFDIKTRKLVWSRSFGTSAKSGPFDIPSLLPIRMGVPNMGGSVATASGLVFIGAAHDRKLRAYDVTTGRVLWSVNLPFVATATPITYIARDGRQYLVIASGGHFAVPGPLGGAIMAFALPEK